MNVNIEKTEENHIRIIKYLNYQKCKVNNNLLQIIKNISESNIIDLEDLEDLEINTHQYSQIKSLIILLQDIPLEPANPESQLYIYYIFIILNLSNNLVKNITRAFLTNLYLEHQLKSKYNYLEIISRNNHLDDLITILQDVKSKNPKNMNLLIDTIHNFFT